MLKQLLNSKKLNYSIKSSINLFLVAFIFNSSVSLAQSSSSNKSAFSARLLNVEATTNEPFRYNAILTNGKSQVSNYNLSATLPVGWQITYRVEGTTVTSLQLESGMSKDINIEITCPISTKPEKFKIPVKAISADDTLQLELEAVVRGSYALEITTPSGRLSDEIVAGNSKEILLVVKNTGTLPLTSLELSSQLPTKWETSFAPTTIDEIQPGQNVDVKVTLKVPEKTIAGDYVTKMTAKSNNHTSEATIRMMVKTSLLSGWIGILVIAIAAGLIYLLIRKYGRR